MSISGLSCIFPSPDIKKTAGFYVSKLGFRAVEYLKSTEPHICLYRDNIEIILLQANTNNVLRFTCRIYARAIIALCGA